MSYFTIRYSVYDIISIAVTRRSILFMDKTTSQTTGLTIDRTVGRTVKLEDYRGMLLCTVFDKAIEASREEDIEAIVVVILDYLGAWGEYAFTSWGSTTLALRLRVEK